MPAYKVDLNLEALAKKIIEEHRPELGLLNIAYMFRDEAPVSDGKVTAGMCVRVDDRNRTLHDFDFMIEISQDVWMAAPDDRFRTAIMDHELGHCGIRVDKEGSIVFNENTGRPKTYIKKHDLEEFVVVLERHGAYHAALRQFLDAFETHKATEEGHEEK